MWCVLLFFSILVSRTFSENQFIPRPKSVEWNGRLVGGRDAEKGQFPHMISLRTIENNHFCGGAIIGDRWIGELSQLLTASK
jgi:secreted trypsin-like serine protease